MRGGAAADTAADADAGGESATDILKILPDNIQLFCCIIARDSNDDDVTLDQPPGDL